MFLILHLSYAYQSFWKDIWWLFTCFRRPYIREFAHLVQTFITWMTHFSMYGYHWSVNAHLILFFFLFFSFLNYPVLENCRNSVFPCTDTKFYRYQYTGCNKAVILIWLCCDYQKPKIGFTWYLCAMNRGGITHSLWGARGE